MEYSNRIALSPPAARSSTHVESFRVSAAVSARAACTRSVRHNSARLAHARCPERALPRLAPRVRLGPVARTAGGGGGPRRLPH